MKQGLLLTLKELIRFGIIKTKRRKKRRSSQLTTMSSMDKAINVPLSIQSKRYNEFISASQPPTQMPYTDNLRLRDEQSNFNTRLLEYKNQLENEKSLLENRQKAIMDDISYSKTAVGNELQKIYSKMNRNSNWEDDNTDVAGTFGSDWFEPQTKGIQEQPPQFVEQLLQPQEPPEFLQIQSSEGEEEEIPVKSPRGRPKSTIPLAERQKLYYQKRKEKKLQQSDDSSLKGFLQSLDEEVVTEPKKKKKVKQKDI